MRPVTRGPAPRAYAYYKDAIDDLEERLGTYCSYCERHLPSDLAIEHILPQSSHSQGILIWANFLLSCRNCNSVKKAAPASVGNCFWPAWDNTINALIYRRDGSVDVQGGLPAAHAAMARKLVDVVGLDRHGRRVGAPVPARRDKRWRQREAQWRLAEVYHKKLQTEGAAVRSTIVDLAKAYGFFSVWFTVFANDPETKRALISAMPGTARNCFDANANPVSRPGGRI